MPDAGPLDRELQRALLLHMRDAYPNVVRRFSEEAQGYLPVLANLAYLREHGLCSVRLHEGEDGIDAFMNAVITARGLDFLADDGGLSAILGVVIVKLHADTIRDLVAAKIEAAPLPEGKKSALRAALAKLPAAVLQEGSKRLMGLGIDHVGDIEGWVQHLSGWLG